MKYAAANTKSPPAKRAVAMLAALLFGSVLLTACTKEQQNRLERGIQNWTGTDGVLDIYAGDSW